MMVEIINCDLYFAICVTNQFAEVYLVVSLFCGFCLSIIEVSLGDGYFYAEMYRMGCPPSMWSIVYLNVRQCVIIIFKSGCI